MARDGSGNYSRVVTPPNNGDIADADDYNAEIDDIATALSDSINRSGTKAFAADQSLGGYKLTNVGTPSADTDAATKGSVAAQITAASQPLDATLTALAALSYTSGTLVITMTAVDTFALTASPVLSAPQVTTLEIGHASDTTLSRVSAGVAAIEGQTILTGANPQVTTIELGHASDTTLARGAAGQPTVEGVYVRLAGKTAIPIPASAMYARTTNGAASGSFELGSTATYKTFDFDQTTQESVQFIIPMPKGWNEGTVTFVPFWTAASGTGGVAWALEAAAISDDDALNITFGSEQASVDTYNGTANDLHVGPESNAITIGGSPAEGDLVIFNLRRQVANAGDTLTADARLIAIRLNITTSAANDA